jgi:hypothetical protein
MRELEKIKKERAAAKVKEEAERAAEEEEQREIDVARGNPLLNSRDFAMKRRWDDDVVFKNQARGTEDRNKKKEFINDMLRSDFHKKFMVSLRDFIASAWWGVAQNPLAQKCRPKQHFGNTSNSGDSPNTYDEVIAHLSLSSASEFMHYWRWWTLGAWVLRRFIWTPKGRGVPQDLAE